MFDNTFDPYEKLMALESNQAQIVLAINTGSELVTNINKQLQDQHSLVVQLITDNLKLQHEVNVLRTEVETLKNIS